MSKNKIVSVIIFIIVALIILLFVINSFFAAKKVNTGTPLQQTTGVATLPESRTKNKIINDPKNLEEINSAFMSATSQPATSEAATLGFQPIEYKDKNSQTIPLGDFIKATGIKINTNIQNLLRENDYFTFRCPKSPNNFEYGVVFHVKLIESNKNLPFDEERWMKEWEKTMFRDTYKIIFPNLSFNDSELNQEIIFRDGKYRFAEVILPDKTKSSINYGIIGDYVVISNSKDCLDKISSYVEPIEP